MSTKNKNMFADCKDISIKYSFKSKQIWLLVITSSALLSLPFLSPHLGLLSLVAFLPLLAAEQIAFENKIKYFFIRHYICFLLWNLATTYWLYNATVPGMIAAVVLNALQMSIVFWLFCKMRTISQGFLPYLFLIIAWLAWEHIYFEWEVSWPWLVLGNAFSTSIKNIQWYEYTGTLGGSLWILLVNILLFRLIYNFLSLTKRQKVVSGISLILLVLLPIILSHIIFYGYKEVRYEPSVGNGTRQFTVLQPNIDPYTDKFYGMSQREQNAVLINLAKEALSDIADEPVVVVAPESFISRPPLILENNPLSNRNFMHIYNFVRSCNNFTEDLNSTVSLKDKHNDVSFILGAITDTIYYDYALKAKDKENTPPTSTARYIQENNLWFDRSNAAVFIDSKGGIQFYHKSKLVVMVESTPYKGLFNFMSRFAIDLGGAMGSYAPQQYREIFTTTDSVKIGTAICYEAVYGDYYREYVLKGAQVMSIITNEGWWGDTPGYRQLLSFASLRAIETRRSIARSANTGISALINQRGEIIACTEWWKPAYLNGELALSNKITVFVKHGDIIGRLSVFMFVLFMLMAVVRYIGNRHTAVR